MDAARFARLRDVVERALELPSAEREAFVRADCADDPGLGREALALLAHEKTAGSALTGALDEQVRVAAATALGNEPLPAGIGDYRIIGKLGEGGMGVVYRAEQTGALRRIVALKLIRAGWSSPQVLARFESERLALARMNHPHIARIFEAGTTADGRPWFAMELVDGLPLTTWCDEHRLDTQERLAIFLAVCRGVQHAHQKGIIHRDLKPSNVLVTGGPGDPAPKIIDFGIAKALGDPVVGQPTMTMAGQQVGSPDYMSPERLEGDSDVDIRSDVYSLGVLLFELLSGRLPFDPATRTRRAFGTSTAAGTRSEPPSLAGKSKTAPKTAITVAACRRTDPARLRRLLRGELDWIVTKALAPDRDQRYGTAREFMQDLERYLAHEPVLAGRPGLLYRTGRFVRRYRVPVTVTAIVVAALTIGVVESQRQRLRANVARNQAETVTAFLSDMLASVRPEEQGREVTVHEVLDQAAGGVESDFAGQPLVRAQLQSTIGQAYTALGELDDAIVQLEDALAIRRQELGDEAPETLAAMCDLGRALSYSADFERAGSLYREALAVYRKRPDGDVASVCEAMNGLANSLADRGLTAEAEPYYLEALAAARAHLGPADSQTCSLLNNLALLRADQGRMDECRDLLVQVLELRRGALGDDHPLTFESVVNLAGLESHVGHLDEAIAALEPLVPRARRVLGDAHRTTLAAMNNLAWACGQQGRLDAAEKLTRETLAIRRRELGDRHPETLITAYNLAELLRQQGHPRQAEALHRRTLALRRQVLGPDHPHTLLSANSLAGLLRSEGRDAAADSFATAAPPASSD